MLRVTKVTQREEVSRSELEEPGRGWRCTGVAKRVISGLRECCRHVEAEVVKQQHKKNSLILGNTFFGYPCTGLGLEVGPRLQ